MIEGVRIAQAIASISRAQNFNDTVCHQQRIALMQSFNAGLSRRRNGIARHLTQGCAFSSYVGGTACCYHSGASGDGATGPGACPRCPG
jgi:hypothetical protein